MHVTNLFTLLTLSTLSLAYTNNLYTRNNHDGEIYHLRRSAYKQGYYDALIRRAPAPAAAPGDVNKPLPLTPNPVHNAGIAAQDNRPKPPPGMEREKTTVEGKKIEAAGGRQNVDKYLTSAAQQGNKPAEDWMKAFTPDGVQKVPKTRAQKGIKMAGNAVLAAGRLVKGGKEKERVRTMDRKSKDSLRSNFGGSREDLLNL